MKKVRLRYAPSPTGFLHIGNTRTALMNYLFAKHFDGDFIVRIEDTDLARNIEGAIASQFANLKWLNIHEDESIFKVKNHGPYIQSEKFERYNKIAHELIDSDYAYICFCTSEELEADYEKQTEQGIVATKYNRQCLKLTKSEIEKNMQDNKPYSIRIKMADKTFKFNDIVRGLVSFEGNDLGDFVILKNTGIATYNFAVVVDDHDMEITHVIRGEEHISNTPRQIFLYEALDWEMPTFCHLTLIVDSTGKKLSKRSGNALFFIEQYKNDGYLPEAVFNYIALLGWSPSGEKEIFTHEEFIKIFDEKRFSKSPSTFDMMKLKWINSQYIKKLDDSKYLEFIIQFVDSNRFNIKSKTEEWINHLLLLFKKEIEFGIQINDHLDPFFNNIEVNLDLISLLKTFKTIDIVPLLKTKLDSISNWNIETIKVIISEIGKELEISGKNLFMPIRILTSKSEHGPSLADVIYLLGKEQVLANISTTSRGQND